MHPLAGKKQSPEHIRKRVLGYLGKKISEEARKHNIMCQGYFSGKRNPNWNGGTTLKPNYMSRHHKLWRKNNPELYRLRTRQANFLRRSRMREAGPVDFPTLQSVYERNIKQYGTLTCYLCFKSIEFGKDSFDHKTPIFYGGKNTLDNLDIAHISCNKSKGTKTETEYREWLSRR